MIRLLFVFIGGGLGSISRYGISRIFDYKVFDFPVATLISNTLASLILGFFLGMEIKSGVADSTRMLVIVGFAGGFSTFSTFSAESVKLISDGQYSLAILNITASLITCFISIFIGIKLGMGTV